MRRSASTRAAAQSRSIVDVAERTVTSALGYEATGDILVENRHLGFSEQHPFSSLAPRPEKVRKPSARNSARCSCRVSSRAA
ncbi:hypothetical protein ACLB1Q_35175 [Escherichia coli]